MSFNLKKKAWQKQFNWRFWFKLCVAIIPLCSAVIFFITQTHDLFNYRNSYWTSTLGTNMNKYKWTLKDYENMSDGDSVAYLIIRNFLMLTTLGNIINSSFFINSALNNKKEGRGNFDNYRYGIMTISTIIFIVLFYNISLAFQNNLSHMHWYNWMSWMCEHMFPQLGMIIYFFAFYPKTRTDKKTITKVKRWFSWMLTSISIVALYNIIFTIIGYILRACKTAPIFGEMSWSGYFPYPFMNFLNENKQIPDIANWMKPWIEFVIVMAVQLIEQVISFAIIYYVCEKQTRNFSGYIELKLSNRRVNQLNDQSILKEAK